MTRRESLLMFGAAALLPSCSPPNAVSLGTNNDAAANAAGELYAAALEHAGFQVARRFGALDADVCISYLENEWSPATNALTHLLKPSRAVVSKCLAVSNVAVEQYNLVTISECDKTARHLRLACERAFLNDTTAGLPALRRTYGSLNFKSVTAYDGDERFYALNRGDADLATATTTDAELAENGIAILEDDRHLWPRQVITPAVRTAVLEKNPNVAPVLDRMSERLTTYVLRVVNMRVKLLDMDAGEVAEDFVRVGHL